MLVVEKLAGCFMIKPGVCNLQCGFFTVSEGGTPPTYKGPVRRVRSPPGIRFD